MLRIMALWIRSEPKEEIIKWDNHLCDMYYWLWYTCMKYELKIVEVQQEAVESKLGTVRIERIK